MNKVSWERAIEILRADPQHQSLINDSYLSDDLGLNCRRYSLSTEFSEIRNIIKKYHPTAKKILDMPGGNGIATFAFASNGYEMTTVEPDPSQTVGRGAIEKVLSNAKLSSNITNAYGESLPLPGNSFDIVFVRQGLHHAQNLPKMICEIYRVLKPSGLLIACREHVVDNYKESLTAFLDAQVDHQLYGGENAFTLPDYKSAIRSSGLFLSKTLGPFDSAINYYPATIDEIHDKILNSTHGKILSRFMPKSLIISLGLFILKRKKTPGRLYTFIATKRAR